MKLAPLVVVFCAVLAALPARATHVRAADLKVEVQCGDNLSYKITVIAYLNNLPQGNRPPTQFGTNSRVVFGDGQQAWIPRTDATVRTDLGKNISVASFEVSHRFQSHGTYTITYIENDRSTGVLNIAKSDEVPYVTQVTINTSLQYGCNNAPILPVPPLDRACHQSTFYHTSGAYDIEGDSLSYELSIPLASAIANALYASPASQSFYLDYQRANEAKTGMPTFSIDAITGLLTWDAPGMIGEYNIAFKIIEWRYNTTLKQYEKLSTTVRDMQIVVEECTNKRPDLRALNDLCVVAGTSIDEIITGIDADNHHVRIEVFSQIIDAQKFPLPGSFSPNPTTFVSPDQSAVNFKWQTDCVHVRQQPYQVVFKITDDPPEGPQLVNFKVWFIRVIAPAPVWNDYSLDLVKRETTLTWNEYACENAKTIQVWRKVGSYSAVQGYCDTRPPSYWGYKLIAELPVSERAFTDTNFGSGLSVGASYCYRLQALITDTRSYVSSEICVGPIQADAPVITHVSVEHTNTRGSNRVSWRTPFNINKVQFPPPYEYEVYRADDFIGDANIVKAGRVTDTTFVDQQINTEDKVFNYRIVLYAKPLNANVVVPIDTSAVSSSVRLKATPARTFITLNWKDSVAWSNVVESRPYHVIYRAIDSDKPEDMSLLDSVQVTRNGFYFTDQVTDPMKMYTYRVLTRGTYGNPKIVLQENYSQTVSVYAENTLDVCSPTLSVKIVNCEQYIAANTCEQTEFSNTIMWSLAGLQDCRRDVKYFRIYGSSRRDGEFQLLADNVLDTFFVDGGLTSFARCYKVSAINKLGVESVLSDSVCNDNCPTFNLPNVFTPNADGSNDLFKAFNGPDPRFGNIIPCPRFVLSLNLKVYDRWGKEVFHYDKVDDVPIELKWDGNDPSGAPLEAGIYFYTADVLFDVLDDNPNKVLKGWVHLVR